MKSKFFFAAIAALVAAFTLRPQQANAKIWRVNNNLIYVAGQVAGQPCDHCFTNLQEAINDSRVMPGDTLHLEASPTPYGGLPNPTNFIEVNKRLVILGPGYFLNANLGLQHNQTPATTQRIRLMQGSAGTIIKGLSISADINNSYLDIVNVDSNITIERCYINRVVFANTVSTPINNIAIRQNYISGGLYHAFQNPNPVNNLVISNNYFGDVVRLGSNYQGIVTQNVFDIDNNNINGYASMVYFNNIIKNGTFVQNTNSVGNVYNNIFNVLPAWLNIAGNTNIAMNMGAVFGSGTPDGQFNPLSSCMPCNGKGMFAGPDPYRLSGVPDIPAIYFLWPETNLVQGGNLPITIKTRTNN